MKNNSLGKDVAILTASKLVTLLIGMISAMLLSRFRTLAEYGTYSQLLMVINMVSSLLLLGLPTSINYFLAKAETRAEKNKFLNVYYTLSTLISALIGGVLILSVPLIAQYFKNPTIQSYAYFLALFPWTSIIMSGIENILIVSGKTKLLTAYRIANSLSLLCIVLLVQAVGLPFRFYMMLYLGVEMLFCIWVYFIANGIAGKLRISFDKATILSILRFSIPMGLGAVVGTLSVELDKLVIGAFMNTESLALYANAGRELPITIVSASITAVLMPRVVKSLKAGKYQETIALWGDATVVSYSIICFFSVAMIVFAPQVMTLLYSEKYLSAVGVFRIYNLVLLLRCTYFGMILNSLGKTKFIMCSSVFSLILNLVLNVFFLKTIGFVGPAIATFLSVLLVNLSQLVFTGRELSISFGHIFPWKQLLRVTLLNIMWGTAAALTLRELHLGTVPKDIAVSIVIGLAFTLLYVLVVARSFHRSWQAINGD